ncbi:unnamed protein product [Toxocara canis]|uniref:Fork-head domain-containing protein n=1 Tax=Toxocara canis TaxID=6265 RepID=A0A183V3T1_TOXCA|nr:unnamed protein product [Toxocara canis]
MKRMRNVGECNTEVEVSAATASNEEASGSEEEEDYDLKSLDWLISYKLPDFYTPLFDDSVASSASSSSSSESSGASASEEDTVQASKTSLISRRKQPQEKALQQEISKCTTLCWLYRILATSPGLAMSLAEIFQKFVELNPERERLSPNWKQSVRHSLLSSACFAPSNSVQSRHVFWTVQGDHARKQQRSALAGGPLHKCPQGDVSTLVRKNDKEENSLDTKIASRRSVLVLASSKHSLHPLKRVNSDSELDSVSPSKRTLAARRDLILDEHCYQKDASLSGERIPQK